jgi:hypothetical protein
MVFAALVLASAGIFWATHESDAISVGRQARSAHHAMETSVDELALQQETVSIWMIQLPISSPSAATTPGSMIMSAAG